MHLSQISLALTRVYGSGGGAPAFSPIDLFQNNEEGAWYDPSDLSTMFQDRAGTTPDTADGQPVGLILDKSKGLVLGPELMVNGDFAADVGWVKPASVVISGGVATATGATGSLYKTSISLVTQKTYRVSFEVTGYSAGTIKPVLYTTVAVNGTDVSGNGVFVQYLQTLNAPTGDIGVTLSGFTGTIDNLSVKELSGHHAVAPSDAERPTYKTDGTYHWIETDGSHRLVSTTIDFPETDKMTLFLGIQSDVSASYGFFTSGNESSAGGFDGYFTGSEKFYFETISGVTGYSVTSSISRGVTNVITCSAARDAATPESRISIRLDGSVPMQTRNGVATTGNFIDQSVCVGNLKTTNGYGFTGKISQFILRVAESALDEVSQTEGFISSKTGVSLFPDSYYPTTFNPMDTASTYDAFGFGLQAANGTHLYFARRGPTAHVGDDGAIHKWTHASGSWTSASIVDTAYDDRNPAGGKSSSGAIILFYGRYNQSTSTWVDMAAIRSTDNGANWSAPYAISSRSNDEYSPYGPMIELPSGKLMQTIYGWASGTYKLWVITSTDDGATWGSPVDVYSGTGANINEGSLCFVSGATDGSSKLLVVSRNSLGKMHQFVSSDGGATWTDSGELNFSIGVDADVSPWLYKDGDFIHLIYTDRTYNKLKYCIARAQTVFENKDTWTTPEVIYDFQNAILINFGYSSMYKSNSGEVVLQFYDSPSGAPNIYSSFV